MKNDEVLVEISARHVHVTQEDLETLFGKGYELTVKKMLSQPGQFASNEKVKVVGTKGEFPAVSILGPVRPATQIEVSLTDARSIGVTAPVRESGDVAGSGACKLVGPCGEVEVKEGVIAAMRHIHATPEDAERWALKTAKSFPLKFPRQTAEILPSAMLLFAFPKNMRLQCISTRMRQMPQAWLRTQSAELLNNFDANIFG